MESIISEAAIEKAKINHRCSRTDHPFQNKDVFQFTHEYAFDEIFTEMPYVHRQKSEEEIYETYQQFFPMGQTTAFPGRNHYPLYHKPGLCNGSLPEPAFSYSKRRKNHQSAPTAI
jgi:hypothetical protein